MSRCYICDWSPTTASFFHDGLELNNFSECKEVEITNKSHQPYAGSRQLVTDRDGRTICSVCNYYGQEPNEWQDLVESAANDNTKLDDFIEEEVA